MNSACIRTTIAALLLVQSVSPSTHAQTARPAPRLTVEQILRDMTQAFSHKIDDTYALTAQIDIKPETESGFADRSKPTLESWHVAASRGKKLQFSRAPNDKVQIIFYTTERALRWLADGTYNPMTAVLRSKSSDPAMIYWERPPGVESTPELREKVRVFYQTFFSPFLPHRYVLSGSHARSVHGSPAIGLYYAPGLRSAWYQVTKGKRLNEPGDKDPHHQAFIFISGEGMAKIGDKTVKVKAGESYYIPPNQDHVVWTNSQKPLVLIWLAWGEGA